MEQPYFIRDSTAFILQLFHFLLWMLTLRKANPSPRFRSFSNQISDWLLFLCSSSISSSWGQFWTLGIPSIQRPSWLWKDSFSLSVFELGRPAHLNASIVQQGCCFPSEWISLHTLLVWINSVSRYSSHRALSLSDFRMVVVDFPFSFATDRSQLDHFLFDIPAKVYKGLFPDGESCILVSRESCLFFSILGRIIWIVFHID